MPNSKFQILNSFAITFIILLSFLAVDVHAQQSPTISLNISSSEVAPESLFEVRILVSSEKEINAFDIELEYSPELFSFERTSTARSVVSLWKSLPFSDGDGTINLVGGSITPWSGANNEIITLIFKARREGTASFRVKNSRLALADGLGTNVETSPTIGRVTVSRSASFASSGMPSGSPQIAGASIIKDPLTENPVIVLQTLDAGNVKWLGVRSRSWLFWSDWQTSQFVAEIPKYAWAAQFKALGFDGEEETATLYRWNIFSVKFFLLIILMLMLLLIRRRLRLKVNAG